MQIRSGSQVLLDFRFLFGYCQLMYSAVLKDPRGGHNRSLVNSAFFQSWSPEMAYILGYIIADGAIEDVQKSSRTCYVTVTSKDLSIIEKIKETLGSSHTIYKRLPQINTFPGGKQYTSHLTHTLRIGSKTMYNDLLCLGVTPRKSLTILFPKIPTNYLSFFIRGYFDGDGCIFLKRNKYPEVIFTSGSPEFLKGLDKKLTQSTSIDSKPLTLNNYGPTPYYQLRYGHSQSKSILEFIYKDLEKAPYLERKYKIYQKYLALKG